MKKNSKYITTTISGFIVIGIVCILYYKILSYSFCTKQFTDLGASFGALSAFFSGLAFWVLIYTLKFQSEVYSSQLFESTFFKMLEFHSNIINSLNYNDNNGRNVLENISDSYNQDIHLNHIKPYVDSIKIILKFLFNNKKTKHSKDYEDLFISQIFSYEKSLLSEYYQQNMNDDTNDLLRRFIDNGT